MKTARRIVRLALALLVGWAILVTCQRSNRRTRNADKLPVQPANRPAGSPSPRNAEPSRTEALRALNHNPIEFFGRVLDQSGNAVGDVAIEGHVLHNTGLSSGLKKAYTTADTQGHFSFTGLEGQSLGIALRKEGYEFYPLRNSFSYSYFEADHKRHVPDAKSPVLFTLWKKQGAEPLVHYDRDRNIPADGSPVRFNLVTGTVGENEADLIVTLTREPLRMRFGQRGFAWRATVEVVGGGLIRAGERQYYNLAPESGYESRFEFVQEGKDMNVIQREGTPWTGDMRDDFFVSSRNGQNFARVTMRFMGNSDRNEGDNVGAVRTIVWLNPNGSRNLEYDPAKAIAPPR